MQRTKEKGILLASALLLILSGIDGAMTLWGLRIEAIEEANPIMQRFIATRPEGVMSAKLLFPVILGALCWLARDRSERFIKYSLGLVLVTYFLTDLFHLYWWSLR